VKNYVPTGGPENKVTEVYKWRSSSLCNIFHYLLNSASYF